MAITLKAARVNAGLTQAELATKLKVGRQSVMNWENGKCSIEVTMFCKICEILKVSMDDIILPNK